MNSAEVNPDKLEAWLASKPPVVRELAKKFPLSFTADINGVIHYLVGYTEGEVPSLILSPINPFVDYDGAMRTKIYVHAYHFEAQH